MRMMSERAWLALAWGVILTSGVSGFLMIWSESRASRPESPQVRYIGCPSQSPDPAKEAWDRFHRSQDVIGPIRLPVTPYVGCMLPKLVEDPKPPVPEVRFTLPSLLYSGKVAMDRVTLRFSWEEPKLVPQPWGTPKRSSPRAIVIHRQFENGEFEPLAVLDPSAVSFEDREVQPNRSYRYWVLLRGEEGSVWGHRSTVRPVEKEGRGEAEFRVPSWHRLSMKGGDPKHAILTVESYNPQSDRWESRTVLASPGQKILGTGWTLDGMRVDRAILKDPAVTPFSRSALVAELTDDRREKRELSTRLKE